MPKSNEAEIIDLSSDENEPVLREVCQPPPSILASNNFLNYKSNTICSNL